MAIVKIIEQKYYCENSICNLINYALDINKTHGYIGAIGANAHEPEAMIQQMMAVKTGFEKNKGYRQARHIVVSFEDREEVTPKIAYFIAYDIAHFYSNKYQICFGIHMNTDNIHIHLIQNTVSFTDGKLFSGAGCELCQFKQHVNNVIRKYTKNTVKTCSMEEFLGEEIRSYD